LGRLVAAIRAETSPSTTKAAPKRSSWEARFIDGQIPAIDIIAAIDRPRCSGLPYSTDDNPSTVRPSVRLDSSVTWGLVEVLIRDCR
jgi:hypothetical protein